MAATSPLPQLQKEDEPNTAGTSAGLLNASPGHGTPDSREPTPDFVRQLSPRDPLSKLQNDARRDSGLAPSNSTTRGSHTTLDTDHDSSSSIRDSPSLPGSTAEDVRSQGKQNKSRRWGIKTRQQVTEDGELPPVPQLPFAALTTEIPTSSMEDLTLPGHVEFTHRGSMLIGGKKANSGRGKELGLPRTSGPRRKPSTLGLSPSLTVPSKLLSEDEEVLSREVRSMYESDAQEHSRKEMGRVSGRGRNVNSDYSRAAPTSNLPAIIGSPTKPEASSSVGLPKEEMQRATVRDDNDLAGGIEDWEDVNGGDVDRYGFIVPRRLPSRESNMNAPRAGGRAMAPEPVRLQRTSTSLQVASETPRRQRSKAGRTQSSKSPARSATGLNSSRPNSRLDRPASSQSSYQASLSATQSKIRSATNRLPHNKGRRFVDEAGDMLTLPPGLADIAETDDQSKMAEALKRKEWDREEKWRRMAKITEGSRDGRGMVFEFDSTSAKLIERTWKGIPDRWRATAWHSFLTASAKKRKVAHSDDELISIFKRLLQQGSPDDVQIDIDVPRTINSHIMFRKRYRGGQRLLFRVLHCMSIYFPDTGYVQGMAALAATLLCYFDEEMTFVMLVRLWQLRGLERLYQSGFEGLMQALDEFENSWLAGGEVSARLTKLGISPTAYGTRWYLTLFNYSIPFPAQLRVWDVFMLLGDPDIGVSTSVAPNGPDTSFLGSLDVLHATSAALIDGMREILLDSDFENAMKVLTSWIPIRDEELLMRVAKVEWKVHRRKK